MKQCCKYCKISDCFQKLSPGLQSLTVFCLSFCLDLVTPWGRALSEQVRVLCDTVHGNSADPQSFSSMTYSAQANSINREFCSYIVSEESLSLGLNTQ